MPRALTIQEKQERAENKVAERQIEQTPTSQGSSRRKRSVFNGTEGKLKVNGQIEGYHLHILNDSPGRIQQALDNGYEFVSPDEVGGTSVNVTERNTDLGDKVRFLVGTNESGGPLYAYLMKIKEEWYQEDQQALQNRIDQVDASIRKGQITGDNQSTDGFYVPREGIKMKT